MIVFGASGAVGRCLLPRLRGAEVYAVSRRVRHGGDAHWIAGDLHGAIAGLPDAARVIVSLGPLDAFAAWFAQAPLAGVGRVLALGSMSADSKRESPDARERELAARLRAAEARVIAAAQARGIAWTLFRSTLIYGAGQGGSLAPIAAFARRWRVLPYPLGACGLRQPVHADDIAAAVFAAVETPATHGRTYPLGGGEALRFDRMLLHLRHALPGFVLPLPVPQFALRAIARSGRIPAFGCGALARLRQPLLAANDAAIADFGYAPRAFVAADVAVPGEPVR